MKAIGMALLAVSDDLTVPVYGAYFHHLAGHAPRPAVFDMALQNRRLEACCRFSGARPLDRVAAPS